MQKIFQGEGSLLKAVKAAEEEGHHHFFLITGRHFQQASDFFFLEGPVFTHFLKEGTNVLYEEVEAAWQAFLHSKASVVLAVGGGSVIDLGKMVMWKCMQAEIGVPLLMAAPTTTGSGSEATQFAVLYENGKKQSINHPQLLPSVIALDPSLVYSLSPYQAAVSGMDALSQAVESHWSKNASPESTIFANDAIRLWMDFFIPSLDAGQKVAREKMQFAAHLAGKAINITRTTGPHALSYYLTSVWQVPHGQAVALFLPVFFLYNNPPENLYRLFNVNSNVDVMELIQQKMVQAGLAINFASLGIDKAAVIEILLAEVNKERFDNNPVPFNEPALQKLILDYL